MRGEKRNFSWPFLRHFLTASASTLLMLMLIFISLCLAAAVLVVARGQKVSSHSLTTYNLQLTTFHLPLFFRTFNSFRLPPRGQCCLSPMPSSDPFFTFLHLLLNFIPTVALNYFFHSILLIPNNAFTWPILFLLLQIAERLASTATSTSGTSSLHPPSESQS